jgi:hypothetical protein
MPITQLIPGALPGQRYGSFSGKTAAVGPITQLIPGALPGQRYSSFAGKVAGFPTQYAGLRTFYSSAIKELCLVLPADAPVGDTPMIDKNGTIYAIYLVPTTDPNASFARIYTSDGIKSIRLKT